MTIVKRHRLFFLVLLAIIFFGLFCISIAFNIFWKDIRLVSEPLHSSIEAFGGMTAVSMAILLLQLHQDGKREKGEYFLLAMGFLMMGILDTFHAASNIGGGSMLLRSLAGICGSVWFALVWLPGFGTITKIKPLPWIVVFFSLLTGVLVLLFREYLPVMMLGERFTPFAVFIYVISGVLLVAAALYFFLEFLRSSTTESYLFTCMFLLSGIPAFQFSFSALWTGDWWFWHVQRYLAYIIVSYFIFRTFLRVRDELKYMNEFLEQRIAERTAELSVEVAERQRYGAERDKVIVELQDALAKIKTLTGLLPTCASCKKIKNEEGHWIHMESYIQDHSSVKFSHGLCPDCIKKLYPEIYKDIFKNLGASETYED